MQIPPVVPGQAVTVEWYDSKARLGWTYNPKLERTPGSISSLGYVVQLNDKCLTITTTMDGHGASLDDFSIPLGCIHKIEVLPQDWQHGGPQEEVHD